MYSAVLIHHAGSVAFIPVRASRW